LIDRRAGRLRWTSAAWQALLPDHEAHTPVEALDAALPGVAAAVAAHAGEGAQHLALGDAGQLEGELAALDADHLALRLADPPAPRRADRREQRRAMQRQLDDREQLLFTSRVISVGEMATTLAHELNQPIGATANLLRGLRSRLTRGGTRRLDAEEATALE